MAYGAGFTKISNPDGSLILVKTNLVGRVAKAEATRWENGLPEFRARNVRYATLDRNGGHTHVVGGLLRHFLEKDVRVHDVLRMCAFAEIDLSDVDVSNALVALREANAVEPSGKGPGAHWVINTEALILVLDA